MSRWVICNGPDWYRPSVTSTKQIVRQFKKNGFRILWVNPIPFKSPLVNSATTKSVSIKLLDKIRTHLKVFKTETDGFYVFVPIYIPLFNSFIRKINEYIVFIQLELVRLYLGIDYRESVLLISGSFTLARVLKKIFHVKIYQAADLISAYRTNDVMLKERLRKEEIRLVNNVDYVLASSVNIKMKLEEMGAKKVYLFPHGVDYEHFASYPRLSDAILEIRKNKKPVAGYFGSLTDANDKNVYKALAENGYSVVLIGKPLGDYTTLTNQQNVYFLGHIPYEELPSIALGFDVCIMCWENAEWIQNSYPIKTLEYLSMGKPIVANPIPMIQHLFGNLLYYAADPIQFVEKCNEAIRNNNPGKENERREMAFKYDWSNRMRELREIINV